MPRIQFLGHTYPVSGLSTEKPLRFKFKDDAFSSELSVAIANGIIVVTCETENEFTAENNVLIYSLAQFVSHAIVDLIAFASGDLMTVSLETVVHHDGQPESILASNSENTAGLVTAYKLEWPDIEDQLHWLVKEQIVLFALHDLIDSMTPIHHLSVVHCARAIETLRNLVAGPGERKQQWATFNERLNLKRAYTDLITEASEGPRHGNLPSQFTNETYVQVVKRSWVIMNRFLEYRKGGNQQLSEPDFPLLES